MKSGLDTMPLFLLDDLLKVIKRGFLPVRKNFNPMFGPYRKLFSMLEDRVVEWCNKAKSGMKEENGRIIN